MSGIRWGYALLAIVTATVAQAVVFDQALLFGDRVRIDGPLLLIVGLGFVADTKDAALLAFVTGLMVDLFQFSPFGLHALVYTLAVWSIGVARVRLLQPGTGFRVVQGASAVVLVTGLSWLVGAVFGQDPPRGWRAATGLAGAAVAGALLGNAMTRVARWMIGAHTMTRLDEGLGA
jgi:rod shape-determining protein MreD